MTGAAASADDTADAIADAGGGARLTHRLRVAALATGAIWAAVVVVWSEGPFALTFDDAYYYFEIASRLADGGGSTFDGIADTNGYHPLWLVLSAIPFALGLEGMAAVRVLLVAQVVLWTAALWVLAGIVGRAAGGWPRIAAARRADPGAAADACEWSVVATFTLMVANPFVVRIAVNGLESILVVVFGVLLLARTLRDPGTLLAGRGRSWSAGTAALLAVLVLSRTDTVLLLATVGVAGLAEVRRRSLGTKGIVALTLLLAPAAVTLAAYSLFNVVAFGGLQVSGVVKRAPTDATAMASFAVLVVVAVVAVVRSGARADRLAAGTTPRFARSSAYTAATAWYGAFGLVLVGYYVLLSLQQWLWYYAPVMLWLVGLAALAAVDLFERGVVEAREGVGAARALRPLQLIVLFPLLVLGTMQVRSFTDPDLRSIQLANRTAAEWIDENLPDDAVLASWDAGVLGFFTDRPVVNLDGVVNGFDWYDATQAGPEAMAAYLDRAGVTHIVNHGAVVDGEDPDIRPYVERLWGADAASSAAVVEYFPFVFSGTTVGSGGRTAVDSEQMAVWIYELPANR